MKFETITKKKNKKAKKWYVNMSMALSFYHSIEIHFMRNSFCHIFFLQTNLLLFVSIFKVNVPANEKKWKNWTRNMSSQLNIQASHILAVARELNMLLALVARMSTNMHNTMNDIGAFLKWKVMRVLLTL